MSITCPTCNSQQITAHKKGFSGKKAVAGALLTGGVGLLAGTIGQNKIVCTCLSCGATFRPGEKQQKKLDPLNQKLGQSKTFMILVWSLILLFVALVIGIIAAS